MLRMDATLYRMTWRCWPDGEKVARQVTAMRALGVKIARLPYYRRAWDALAAARRARGQE